MSLARKSGSARSRVDGCGYAVTIVVVPTPLSTRYGFPFPPSLMGVYDCSEAKPVEGVMGYVKVISTTTTS